MEGGDPRQGTLNEGDRLYIPDNYPKRVVILVILLVAMAGTDASAWRLLADITADRGVNVQGTTGSTVGWPLESEVLVQKLVVESLIVITLVLRPVGVVAMVDVTSVTGFIVLELAAVIVLLYKYRNTSYVS